MAPPPHPPAKLLTARHFMAGPVWDECRDWLVRLFVPFRRFFFWPDARPPAAPQAGLNNRTARLQTLSPAKRKQEVTDLKPRLLPWIAI